MEINGVTQLKQKQFALLVEYNRRLLKLGYY